MVDLDSKTELPFPEYTAQPLVQHWAVANIKGSDLGDLSSGSTTISPYHGPSQGCNNRRFFSSGRKGASTSRVQLDGLYRQLGLRSVRGFLRPRQPHCLQVAHQYAPGLKDTRALRTDELLNTQRENHATAQRRCTLVLPCSSCSWSTACSSPRP